MTWTPEAEREALAQELAQAHRRVDELERAPSEGRQHEDPEVWHDRLLAARQRVRVLRDQLADCDPGDCA